MNVEYQFKLGGAENYNLLSYNAVLFHDTIIIMMVLDYLLTCYIHSLESVLALYTQQGLSCVVIRYNLIVIYFMAAGQIKNI